MFVIFCGKNIYHFLIMRTHNKVAYVHVVMVLQNNNSNGLLFCKVILQSQSYAALSVYNKVYGND